MRTFVVSLLLVSVAFAQVDFSFKGNLTVEALDKFKFRASTLEIVTGNFQGIPAKGLLWSSGSVGVSVFNTTASVDAIGAFHMTGVDAGFVKIPAMSFGTFLSGKAKVDSDLFYRSFSGHPTVEGTVGLIGFLIPGLLEVDPSGNVVSGISFGTEWTEFTFVESSPNGVTVFNSSIKYCEDAEITEYIVSSPVAGRIKFGNTPVSPNTLEVILNIKDYKYAEPGNHLELIFVSAAVTEEGKGQADLDIVFNNITDDLTTYVALRSEAAIGKKGTTDKVVITAVEESSLDSKYRIDQNIKAVIMAGFKLHGTVQYNYRKISFPVGATHIVFDPAIGAGQNIYKYTSVSSSIVLSIFAVLFAALLLF